jgi:hypothetical protein
VNHQSGNGTEITQSQAVVTNDRIVVSGDRVNRRTVKLLARLLIDLDHRLTHKEKRDPPGADVEIERQTGRQTETQSNAVQGQALPPATQGSPQNNG